jgi:hypothetical protein
MERPQEGGHKRRGRLRVMESPATAEAMAFDGVLRGAVKVFKEGADYRLYQTHYTGNRRRGDGAGRTAGYVCSTDRERRKCHALLRKRRGSHPL